MSPMAALAVLGWNLEPRTLFVFFDNGHVVLAQVALTRNFQIPRTGTFVLARKLAR
jgi:hypothetical protein